MTDGDTRLQRAERLRRAADYRRVFRDGVRADGRLMSLVIAPGANTHTHARLGLAAGRRVGGAVQRNRVKRLVRESFRTESRPAGVDVVVVPKAAMAQSDQAAVAGEYTKLLERLRRRLRAVRGARPAAASD